MDCRWLKCFRWLTWGWIVCVLCVRFLFIAGCPWVNEIWTIRFFCGEQREIRLVNFNIAVNRVSLFECWGSLFSKLRQCWGGLLWWRIISRPSPGPGIQFSSHNKQQKIQRNYTEIFPTLTRGCLTVRWPWKGSDGRIVKKRAVHAAAITVPHL